MRIVSYNINGLRPRVAESRSLSLFLDSLNADIICLQETKISRQLLTADIAVAEGYESFFSCNRTGKNGLTNYSGVATFCRVGQTSASTNPALPLAADEGFTGLLHFSRLEEVDKGRVGCYEEVFKTELSAQDLLRLDSEGRCLVTDHGAFVLFNIYAPNVETGDEDRQEFKGHFFRTLQRRWEGLLSKGRRVIVVGDFNVSPYAIDHCHPGPEFDKHVSRKWLRSMLDAEGGPFRDVFRFIHPDRKEAYTCWSQVSGAEEFNYGSRIDLIIAAGPCSHETSAAQEVNGRSHGFVECEVQDSDILSEFRRVKVDTVSRWHGGRSIKLDGSDHAPVYVQLKEQRQVELHEVPSLAARYMPELRGRQQNLVSLLKTFSSVKTSSKTGDYPSFPNQKRSLSSSPRQEQSRNKRTKGKLGNLSSGSKQDAGSTQRQKQSNLRAFFVSSSTNSEASVSLEVNRTIDNSVECQDTLLETRNTLAVSTVEEASRPLPTIVKQTDGTKISGVNSADSSPEEVSLERSMVAWAPSKTIDGIDCMETSHSDVCRSSQTEFNTSDSQEKPDAAFEWKRIKSAMARAVPLCHGHKEPCVARIVKKQGPNKGRGFYVCARPEGPSSNPEAGCGHFEWSSSSMRAKGKVLGK